MGIKIVLLTFLVSVVGAWASADTRGTSKVECQSRKPGTGELLTTKFEPAVPSLERVTAPADPSHGAIGTQQVSEPLPTTDVYISKSQICGVQLDFANDCSFTQTTGPAEYVFEFVCGDKVAGHVRYYYNMLEYLCRFGPDGAKAEQVLFPGCRLN